MLSEAQAQIVNEGKRRSRGNAWKHGLTAEHIVIYNEHPSEFEAFRAELWEQLAPLPGLESMLVERLASLEWRIRRVPFFEAAALDTYCIQLADTQPEDGEDEREELSQYLGRAIMRDAADCEVLRKISRYEAALLSAHTRTLETFLRVRHMRREEPSHIIDTAPPEKKTVTRFRPKLLKAQAE
jgi:hypothetical protein